MKRLTFITTVVALQCASAAFGQLYQTDFTTAQGWSFSSSPCAAQWHWAVDATPANHFAGAFRSAPASLNFNDGATVGPVFGAVSCGIATSPLIDLTSATGGARVEFWFSYEFNQGSACLIDSTTLEVSNDGFQTLLLNECLPSLGPVLAAWHQLGYDLDHAWGSVQLRFRFFGTNGVGFNDPTGPFIDDLVVRALCPPFASYCVGAPNTGSATGARMGAVGSGSVSANNLRLYATGTATSTFGLFFYGDAAIQVPSGNGFVCVGGSVFRLPTVTTGPVGTPSTSLDVSSPPQPGGAITSGSTWHFQCWFRDGSPGWNYSDGLRVTFCD
jgi:hypothetical protein